MGHQTSTYPEPTGLNLPTVQSFPPKTHVAMNTDPGPDERPQSIVMGLGSSLLAAGMNNGNNAPIFITGKR